MKKRFSPVMKAHPIAPANRPTCPLRFLPLAAGVALLSSLATLAQGANVALVGVQQDLGPGWRTPTVLKAFDPDGDNVLGSDGYHLINLDPVWPSYVTSTEVLTTTSPGNAGYVLIDQPTGVPGFFPTGSLNLNPGTAASADLLRFTLGPTVVGRTVRLSLLVDNLDNAGFNATSLTLAQTKGGSASVGLNLDGVTRLNNRTPDWVTFEITDGRPGDVFVVRGNGRASPTAALGGVAFDSVPSFGTERNFTQQDLLNAGQLFDGASTPFSGMAISGDTLVVGHPSRNAVVVLVRSGSGWVQQALLQPHNPGPDQFGWQVAISGDTMVVGAPREASGGNTVNSPLGGHNGTPEAGAAYVFVRDGTNWTQQAYLKASNNGTNLRFGGAVAVHGNTVVVGAGMARAFDASPASGGLPFGSTGNNNVGAAYAFVRNGTNWIQQAQLIPANGDPGDGFGLSVALFEDTAVIGAPYEASASTQINGDAASNVSPGAGAAYVFKRTGNAWSQQAYLKSDNNDPGNSHGSEPGVNLGDRFGWQVALSGNTALIGAPFEDTLGLANNNLSTNSGAAYVFVRSQDQWTQQAMLKATDRWGAAFGSTLALSGDSALIGEYVASDPQTPIATYVFERNGSNWLRRGNLIGSEPGASLVPPSMLALSGGTAAIRVQTNLFLFSTDAPRLVVQDEAGFDLAQPIATGTMALQDGGADELTLTLRNTGTASLTNIAAAISGPDAAGFVLTARPATSLLPGVATSLTVRFVDTSGTFPKQATLRLTSSDPTQSPWVLNLSGISLLSTADSDFDGLNDVAEFQLRAMGFDPFLKQPTLVKALNLGGLYTQSQIQALTVGKPLLQPVSPGTFRLTLGLQKATHLTNFTPFPMVPSQTTINGQGQVQFEFTSPENAAFYLLNVE